MLKQFKHSLAILLLVVVSNLATFAVVAQESTEPAPVVTEEPIPVLIVDSPSEEGTSSDSSPALPESFSAILFAAPLVLMLVAFVKPFIPNISAGTLNFFISLVVYVLYMIASQNGLASQFEAFTGGITSVVDAVSNLLTGVIGTGLLSAGFYHSAKKANVPFIGASRPKPSPLK